MRLTSGEMGGCSDFLIAWLQKRICCKTRGTNFV